MKMTPQNMKPQFSDLFCFFLLLPTAPQGRGQGRGPAQRSAPASASTRPEAPGGRSEWKNLSYPPPPPYLSSLCLCLSISLSVFLPLLLSLSPSPSLSLLSLSHLLTLSLTHSLSLSLSLSLSVSLSLSAPFPSSLSPSTSLFSLFLSRSSSLFLSLYPVLHLSSSFRLSRNPSSFLTEASSFVTMRDLSDLLEVWMPTLKPWPGVSGIISATVNAKKTTIREKLPHYFRMFKVETNFFSDMMQILALVLCTWVVGKLVKFSCRFFFCWRSRAC